ncbi:MAG: tRNA (N(6)-L-threonylcarbamoyladenosine(37)-C(2))-methylthiotransferase [Candidatus Marsarchaeota archaeon]|jgi:MiaB-like tRNA modifying enzyme|nr:tRNA (N(6)-L-threonylcarbamoyladenosine(37)-C(2))-methylthiotransferase [Candidatus Marsarchaeota archaeon]MCL5111894.1 tRNA (N(6)-L-threonylcarbamoyladenosine(37)-C(2))-methylthiotransferase [Candidatus Marsarchaeota archaeon]
MKAYIKTYGCTLNQADGDLMASILESNGVEIADSIDDSDVVVLNTCTVKKPTEQRTLHVLKKLSDAGKRMVVAGCMVGSRDDAIARCAPGASLVNTSNVHHVYDAVSAAYSSGRALFDGRGRTDKLAFFSQTGGVIARIPINDGCISSCAFCETKHARGRLNSFSEELILKAVERSVRGGAKEIQITSQDAGAYGIDRNTDVAELMEKISKIDGDFKVRVGMLNPEHLDRCFDRFADAMLDSKFYKFVHLPVQSGSNRVLSHMGRRYTAEEFIERVRAIRQRIPEASIETDVIVGYPVESLSDFDATIDMIKEVKPDVTNISKFCARPHARAARLKAINNKEVSRRSMVLSRLVRSVQNDINRRMVGMSVKALMTEITGRSVNGRSQSYKQVVIPGRGACVGDYVVTKIAAASANAIYGS